MTRPHFVTFTGRLAPAILAVAVSVCSAGAMSLQGAPEPDRLAAPGVLLVRLTSEAAASNAFTLRGTFGDASRPQSAPSFGLTAVDDALLANGLTEVRRPRHIPRRVTLARDLGLDRDLVVRIADAGDLDAVAATLRMLPDVEDAQPDWLGYPNVVPIDPLYSIQWGHDNQAQMQNFCWGCGGHPSGSTVGTVGFDADVAEAWDSCVGFGDPSIVIAILDTGVDLTHPDLSLVTGYDFGDNDSNPQDNSNFSFMGHGTNCAGVAAAIANNQLGAAGVAPGCSVMPLKISDFQGNAPTSAIVSALTYAADNGANVASISYSFAPSTALSNAVNYAFNAGVAILGAAGNNNASALDFPAAYTNVIAIGAASPCGERKRSSSNGADVNAGVSTDPLGVTCDNERWWGSNYGTGLDLLAPTMIPTTDIQGPAGFDPSNYNRWFNGTSASTPFAAGVAALILSRDPSLTPTQVRQIMTGSATDVTGGGAGPGYDTRSGWGLVNAAAALGPTFADATPASPTMYGGDRALAWGDYDGDGDDDLYIPIKGDFNRLYRNDGGGTFADVSAPPIDDFGWGIAASWGDYDNDGDEDLYLLNEWTGQTGWPSKLFRNDGSAFADVTPAVLGTWGRDVSWVDFENDGDLDLWINDSSSNRLFRNENTTSFLELPSIGSPGQTASTAWADYDNDGDLDVYLVKINDNAPNRLLRNDGGTFIDATPTALANNLYGQGATWGDIDNDGDLDLYTVNYASANALLRNNGNGVFVNITTPLLANATEISNGAAFFDYDLDGDLDLMLSNNQFNVPGISSHLFKNIGGGTFVDATDDSLEVWANGAQLSAMTDYDLDGDVDFYVARRTGVPDRLIRNDAACTNSWTQIVVTGTQSNTSGIGARVRVVTGGTSQIREIVANGGMRTQHSLVAMFGLGNATTIDTIQVLWPSGATQTVTGGFAAIPVNTRVALEEPDPVVDVGDDVSAPLAWATFAAAPNPVRGSTRIRFSIPARMTVRLDLYDVAGRRVRGLLNRVEAPGLREVVWDGRDGDGRPVSPGIYFYRVRAGRHEQSERLVVIR